MRPDPQSPTAELLVAAYCRGIFPMASSETRRVEWYSPDPRGIIPLERFHVPRSLDRVVRRRRFELRTDTCFERVMRCCAEPRRSGDGTWIDERLIEAYVELHRQGSAHCVEAWRDERLVGGLYGVHLGGAFFGESMFSRAAEGGGESSKVCLVRLVRILREQGFRLLDTQFWTRHLDQFGCIEISREDYLAQLATALRSEASWPAPGMLGDAGA